MIVELYIRGKIFHTWEFEYVVYYEPLCEVNHEEQKELWARVIENCKREMEPILKRYPYEFHVIVPARIQPADVDLEEQERFLQQIIENQNSSL